MSMNERWSVALGPHDVENDGARRVMFGTPDDDDYWRVALVTRSPSIPRRAKYNTPDPERDARARLIAAAPNLLAALEEIVRGDTTGTYSGSQCVEIAQAALAKVRG